MLTEHNLFYVSIYCVLQGEVSWLWPMMLGKGFWFCLGAFLGGGGCFGVRFFAYLRCSRIKRYRLLCAYDMFESSSVQLHENSNVLSQMHFLSLYLVCFEFRRNIIKVPHVPLGFSGSCLFNSNVKFWHFCNFFIKNGGFWLYRSIWLEIY